MNYWPSNVEKSGEVQQPKYEKTAYSSEPINGQRVKEDLFVGDDYIQAGQRIRSMDAGRCAQYSPRNATPRNRVLVANCLRMTMTFLWTCKALGAIKPELNERAWCGQGGAHLRCGLRAATACASC